MGAEQLSVTSDQQKGVPWRLYHNILVTRLFEDACMRWRKEGKISAQIFPSRGQEAVAVGACLALERSDTVIPSFRTRGAMVSMGVTIAEQLREIVGSRLAAAGSRDAPHHSSWPDRGVMPGSTMIGGHLALAAGLALAMQLEKRDAVSLAFFGDGTLGSGDFHETLHIAGIWGLPLILVCENNGWEMATPWHKVRKQRSLTDYASPYGLATRTVDGNDALDVYHSTRWARTLANGGRSVFLDCLTFRTGTYSSSFGEVRNGFEQELSEWEHRDPLKRMADWLIAQDLATAEELAQLRQAEEERIQASFKEVLAEVRLDSAADNSSKG